MAGFIRRSWCEIDLSVIRNNYECYKNQLKSGSVMAVVKADAYGHGAVKVASVLADVGVKDFAVSNINEAIELREAGIEGQVLILGYTPLEAAPLLVQYDITQALLSEQYTEDLIRSGIRVKCQYAIDTGMNRIGLDADDAAHCADAVRRANDSLNLNGLFTHLCAADTPSQNAFTEMQIEKFKKVSEAVSDLKLPYVHCLNSAGGLWYQTEVSVFARLGIILYGLKPDYMNVLPEGIKPAMEWKSVISMKKTVHPGETVGYGRTFCAGKEMTVATIPTGYADGYNRLLSNKGYVLINGKKAPVIGRICMDQFMADVTGIDCSLYDEVVLLGRSGDEVLTADDMAQMTGTIGYEVLCDIGKRVQRVYSE